MIGWSAINIVLCDWSAVLEITKHTSYQLFINKCASTSRPLT